MLYMKPKMVREDVIKLPSFASQQINRRGESKEKGIWVGTDNGENKPLALIHHVKLSFNI